MTGLLPNSANQSTTHTNSNTTTTNEKEEETWCHILTKRIRQVSSFELKRLRQLRKLVDVEVREFTKHESNSNAKNNGNSHEDEFCAFDKEDDNKNTPDSRQFYITRIESQLRYLHGCFANGNAPPQRRLASLKATKSVFAIVDDEAASKKREERRERRRKVEMEKKRKREALEREKKKKQEEEREKQRQKEREEDEQRKKQEEKEREEAEKRRKEKERLEKQQTPTSPSRRRTRSESTGTTTSVGSSGNVSVCSNSTSASSSSKKKSRKRSKRDKQRKKGSKAGERKHDQQGNHDEKGQNDKAGGSDDDSDVVEISAEDAAAEAAAASHQASTASIPNHAQSSSSSSSTPLPTSQQPNKLIPSRPPPTTIIKPEPLPRPSAPPPLPPLTCSPHSETVDFAPEGRWDAHAHGSHYPGGTNSVINDTAARRPRPPCRVYYRPATVGPSGIGGGNAAAGGGGWKARFEDRLAKWEPFYKCVYDVTMSSSLSTSEDSGALQGGKRGTNNHASSTSYPTRSRSRTPNQPASPPSSASLSSSSLLVTSRVLRSEAMALPDPSKKSSRRNANGANPMMMFPLPPHATPLDPANQPRMCLSLTFTIPSNIAQAVGRNGSTIAWGNKHAKKSNNTGGVLDPPKDGERRLIVRMLPLKQPACASEEEGGDVQHLQNYETRADTHLWPKGTFIQVNEKAMGVAALKQRRQQSHDERLWKGMCFPLDLTGHITKPTEPNTFTLLSRELDSDGTVPYYAMQIAIVEFCSPAYVFTSLTTTSLCDDPEVREVYKAIPGLGRVIPYDEAVAIAVRYVKAQTVVLDSSSDTDEDKDNHHDDPTATITLALRCNMSMKRIQVPVRGARCRHVQCFDLYTYLNGNAYPSGRRWMCPCCDVLVAPNDLVVCGLFQDILNACKNLPDMEEVLVSSDGSWRCKVEEEAQPKQPKAMSLTPSVAVKQPSTPMKTEKEKKRVAPQEMEPICIIDDSDEEDEEDSNSQSHKSAGCQSSNNRRRKKKRGYS